MLRKWLDEYQLLMQRTLLLSQATAFAVASLAILSLVSYWIAIYHEPSYLEVNTDRALIISLFHLGIATFFSIRFAFTFSSLKKYGFANQFVWLICLMFIIGYWTYSIEADRAVSAAGIYVLRHAGLWEGSLSLSVISWFYMILSPIREFITAIVALFKAR